MTLQNKLQGLGDALSAAIPNTYHYWRPKMDPPFLVWREDGENGLSADSRKAEQAVTGTADYFTRTEYDPAIDTVQAALDAHGASWSLVSVDFEEETNLIHYSWDWEVLV